MIRKKPNHFFFKDLSTTKLLTEIFEAVSLSWEGKTIIETSPPKEPSNAPKKIPIIKEINNKKK